MIAVEDRTYDTVIGERPDFTWPDGHRMAVWVAVNIEHYEYVPPVTPGRNPWPRVPVPDVMAYGAKEYGNRVGLKRVFDAIDRVGIKATASLNLGVLGLFPDVAEALVARDWAVMSHGVYNTRVIHGMSEEDEREYYRWSVETLAAHTGRRLRGMLTPGIAANDATPELMAEAGLWYHADWVNDDQPVPLRLEGAGRLISVPYTFDLNTAVVFGRHDAEHYERTAYDQFEVLAADSASAPRVMCLSVHPFLIGQAHAIGAFERMLERLVAHPGVWWTTGDDLAAHYLDHCYDEQVAFAQERLAGRGPA